MISIVVPTIRKIADLKYLIESISLLIQKIDSLIIVNLDITTQDEYVEYIQQLQKISGNIQNLHCITNYSDGRVGAASTARNIGIIKSYELGSDFTLCIDDDNGFDPDFLDKLCARYKELSDKVKTDIVVMPTVYLHKSNNIQQQGFNSYWHILNRPEPHFTRDLKSKIRKKIFGSQSKKIDENNIEVLCNGGNCFFAPTKLLYKNLFDESFDFVYEDLERSTRLSKSGIKVIVPTDIGTYHYERKTGSLNKSFLGTPQKAYQKVRNRIRYARKFATKAEYILFLCFGLPFMILWTLGQIILHSTTKYKSLRSLGKGRLDGVFNKLYPVMNGKTIITSAYLKGYYGYENFGDEVMLLGVINFLHKKYDIKDLIIEAQNIDSVRAWLKINNDVAPSINYSVKHQTYRQQLLFGRSTDRLLVVGAGEILSVDKYGFFRGGFHIIMGWFKQFLQGNYILMGGITQTKSLLGSFVYKLLLKKSYANFFRDKPSYEYSKQFTNKCILYHDWAQDIVSVVNNNSSQIMESEIKSDYRLFNANGHVDSKLIQDKLTNWIQQNSIEKIILFPCTWGNQSGEYDNDKKLMESFDYGSCEIERYDRRNKHISEICQLFKGAKGGLGVRLHFLLFCHWYNLKYEMIVYAQKVIKLLGNQ